MSGKTDVVKGRIKEAAGVLINNDKLRAEGQTDQAVGQVKQAAQKVVDTAQDAAVKIGRAAKKTARQAVKAAKDVATFIRRRGQQATKPMCRSKRTRRFPCSFAWL